MARIYVIRRDGVIVLSRRRPGLMRVRPVRRPWDALAEIPPRTGRPPGETALVFAPPVALGALAAAFAPAGVGVAVGGAALIASTYLTPVLRGRAAARRLRRPENILLRGEPAKSDFDRTLAIADRVSETWPGLGRLVEPDEASTMLAEALWQIAAVLARREELDAALAVGPADLGEASVEASLEVRSQVSSAKAARARVEADFVRREAGLRRAEDAGRDFLREQQMRQAIRAADQTLRPVPPTGLSTSGLSTSGLSTPGLSTSGLSDPCLPDPRLPDPYRPALGRSGAAAVGIGAAGLDAGADLADHIGSVLAAYRELTAGLTPG